MPVGLVCYTFSELFRAFHLANCNICCISLSKFVEAASVLFSEALVFNRNFPTLGFFLMGACINACALIRKKIARSVTCTESCFSCLREGV